MRKCGGWLGVLCLIVGFAQTTVARAGDWPQILGPERNGVAVGGKIAAWPASGPALLWSHKLGAGYAGPVVAQGKLVLFYRADDEEKIEGVDAASGKSLWTSSFSASYGGGIDSDTGPRAT